MTATLLWGKANEHETPIAVFLSVFHVNFFSAALAG